MNENEACKMAEYLECGEKTLMQIGEILRSTWDLERLAIHTNHSVYGFDRKEMTTYTGMHVEHPVLTTGAGDHFNAGFCMGILEGERLQQSLIRGQAMASCYISTGKTPDRTILETYLCGQK